MKYEMGQSPKRNCTGKGIQMFGKENGKEIRLALEETGCNMNTWKQWQKKYEKLLKQLPAVREKYQHARTTTKEVEKLARGMERMIADRQQTTKEKEFAELVKELKKMQNTFDHPFLISGEDKEFHSTYDSILKLGTRAWQEEKQCLILQSEIENLLALLAENLDRKEPDLNAFGYYCMEYDLQMLTELSPMVRLEKVESIYESEFKRPFIRMVSEGILFADGRKPVLVGSTDRDLQKQAEHLRILWRKEQSDATVEQRAEDILTELMKMEG